MLEMACQTGFLVSSAFHHSMGVIMQSAVPPFALKFFTAILKIRAAAVQREPHVLSCLRIFWSCLEGSRPRRSGGPTWSTLTTWSSMASSTPSSAR